MPTAGSVWRYRDTASDPGTNWRAPDFNDTSWPSGPGQLGFGDRLPRGSTDTRDADKRSRGGLASSAPVKFFSDESEDRF